MSSCGVFSARTPGTGKELVPAASSEKQLTTSDSSGSMTFRKEPDAWGSMGVKDVGRTIDRADACCRGTATSGRGAAAEKNNSEDEALLVPKDVLLTGTWTGRLFAPRGRLPSRSARPSEPPILTRRLKVWHQAWSDISCLAGDPRMADSRAGVTTVGTHDEESVEAVASCRARAPSFPSVSTCSSSPSDTITGSRAVTCPCEEDRGKALPKGTMLSMLPLLGRMMLHLTPRWLFRCRNLRTLGMKRSTWCNRSQREASRPSQSSAESHPCFVAAFSFWSFFCSITRSARKCLQ
mmetsp:Transcript_16939/g.45907  ORF Transcript_16939/g.45907 Transcript_16939/m.45907 type:complete len:294 (+) Transcript_16939:131-1012(+)